MKKDSQMFVEISKNDDLLIPKLFFNTLMRFGFISSIERLVDQKMVADEYNGCSFPGDLDAGEVPFEGIKFRYIDDEIIVDETTFRSLLKEACEGFIKHHPAHEESVRQVLKRIGG